MPEWLEPHKFKEGQSGNPSGRPKGSRNRATVLAELYETVITGQDVDGKDKSMPVEYHIMKSLVMKAISGDVAAIKEAQDTVYGKVSDKTELTGANGGAIVTETVLPDSDRDIITRYLEQKGKQDG